MIVVLVVGAGADWEPVLLTRLEAEPGIVVLKRCVDVDDLLASASSGQADVAVVGIDALGLDHGAVDHLRAQGVRPVAVVAAGIHDQARVRAARIGIGTLVPDDRLGDLPALLAAPETDPELETDAGFDPGTEDAGRVEPTAAYAGGRVLVVWGPGGGPGRTTLAAAVAAELARRGQRAILVDADPYGGAVAQQLGILDEVSGILSAARLALGGGLAEGLGTVLRGLGPCLAVVTGLPRADRWIEVRSGVVEHLLELGRERAVVVADVGFSLEVDELREQGGRPQRNQMTFGALDVADEVLVVGTADPVGLARLARGLVELREHTQAPVRVVVNRMRPTLGWSERDIAGMVAGVTGSTRPLGVHFLPEDRTGVDRALITGRGLAEASPDGALTRAVAELVDELVPVGVGAPEGKGRVRWRTAARARRS